MTAFEVLIQFLQAYIFTLLASIYIQPSARRGPLSRTSVTPHHHPYRPPPANPPPAARRKKENDRRARQPRRQATVPGRLGAVAYGLAPIGPGVGVGLVFGHGVAGHGPPARACQPIRTNMFLGFALCEVLALLGLVVPFRLPELITATDQVATRRKVQT